MEQRKEGLLATSPGRGPRLRRKLQKCIPRQQTNIVSWVGSSNPAATPETRDPTDNKPTSRTPPRPSPPLRDNRRTLREGRFYQHDPTLETLELLKPQTYVVPEFSHLIPNPQPQAPSSGSESTNPPTPRMRRRAKTPIFSAGQLEDMPRPTNTLGRTSSVDLIAEQYRAVLESQRCSVYSDDSEEPALSPRDSDTDEPPVTLRRRRSSGYLQNEAPLGEYSTTRMVELPNPSPTSDDGTLVSFQDEGTVYFKPLSFSPEPPEESPGSRIPLSRQTSAEDNVSLQICLDLLTRELSSAIAGRPCPSPKDTSALQIWAMIEAYERLRDQMAELSHSNEQARSMEMMFDMWLRALYSIHDTMAAGAREEKE
ncbi:hypothetical protein C8A01DRAFT_47256 [Parachaetomium inaequale]|uniref:Mating-type switching protein swi10 n=1 Tax=Parachaetomium inaequale TaxID=2588326 RepID=A0AAN6SQU9_9PEZI|nr:hypothetical protein C8A01DRAFT_47256 [Parachaetomium inaequale]